MPKWPWTGEGPLRFPRKIAIERPCRLASCSHSAGLVKTSTLPEKPPPHVPVRRLAIYRK